MFLVHPPSPLLPPSQTHQLCDAVLNSTPEHSVFVQLFQARHRSPGRPDRIHKPYSSHERKEKM